jgi:hypothetical protein
MLNSLRTHFREAAEYIRLIGREAHMLDRAKIVPEMILEQLPAWPQPMIAPLNYKLTRNHARAFNYRLHQIHAGNYSMYAGFHWQVSDACKDSAVEFFEFHMRNLEAAMKDARHYEQLVQIRAGAEEMRRGMRDGDMYYSCRPLGEWLEDHEATIGDPGLQRWSKISCYAGQGAPALEFWRKVNALPDWSNYVQPMQRIHPPHDPRKRKDRRQESAVPVWAPVTNTI